MKFPICSFDAKNSVLCPQCESKLETGKLSKADVDAAIKLAQLAKKNQAIDKFTLSACKEINGNFILYLNKDDIMTVRKSRTLYKIIQEQFSGRIWLVESEENDKRFIEDLFFPVKILSINSVWSPSGTQRTKTVVSGRWSHKFPIDLDRVIQIVKNARNLDMEIEFEEKRA